MFLFLALMRHAFSMAKTEQEKEQHRERVRRYRRRSADGVITVQVESPPDFEDALVYMGYLPAECADDLARVRSALTRYLSDQMEAAVMHHAGDAADVRQSPSLPSAATKSAGRTAVFSISTAGRQNETRDHADSKPRITKLPVQS